MRGTSYYTRALPNRQRELDEEKKDALEKAADEDEKIDKLEKEAVHALRFVQAKEPARPGQPLPYSASTALAELRAAKFKLRIEPMVDADGHAQEGLLALRDSYTDRVQELSRKMAEQKASQKELREIQAGAKYMVKLNDLRSQVSELTTATFDANTELSAGEVFRTMGLVARMVGTRRRFELQFSDEDYDRVRAQLDRQHRVEAIAGATLAMTGAFQAAINAEGDPKALDLIADNALQAFPVKPSATKEEAAKYVATPSQASCSRPPLARS